MWNDMRHKQVIKVLVVIGNGRHVAKKRGNITVGLLYDIWAKMKTHLNSMYTFDETFEEHSNYDKMVKWVAENKYDLIIGPFQYTEDRLKIIDFTAPIILSKNTILYVPQRTPLSTFFTVSKNVLEPVLILVGLGILFGILLYIFDTGRYKLYTGPMKKFVLRRMLLTSIAAMFGELGFMSENSSLSIPSIIIVSLVMITSFFVVTYIQGIVLKHIIDIQNSDIVNRENIKDKVLLSPSGYAVSKTFNHIGARIKYIDDSIDNIVNVYLKNKDTYNGIALDYMDAIGRQSSTFKISKDHFGFLEVAFVISKSKHKLKHLINVEILKMQESLMVEHVCKAYLDKEDTQLCII